MSQTLPLSVLVINHRSDQRLTQALNSVSFAQEIIVVDQQNEPNWSKFSHLSLRIIYHHQPITDFSLIKNQYAQQAQHDWILFLDSDEVISPELAVEIKLAINQSKTNGFYIKRLDIFYDQVLHFGEVRNIWLLRLAKKKLITFVRPVHEVASVSGATAKLKNPIYHLAHRSIAEFYQKINYYADLEAKYRYQQGKKFSWLEMIIFPIAKFECNYWIKFGCLDGYRGLIYALMMSLHSFLVRVKLYELTNSHAKI